MPAIIRTTIPNTYHCKYEEKFFLIIAGIYVFTILHYSMVTKTSARFLCHLLIETYLPSGVAIFLGEILCILRAYSLE